MDLFFDNYINFDDNGDNDCGGFLSFPVSPSFHFHLSDNYSGEH